MKVFGNLVVPLFNCRGLCANLYNNAGEAQYKKSTNKKPNNPDGIHAGSPINSISAKSYCCLEGGCNYAPQRHRDANALYTVMSRGFVGEIGLDASETVDYNVPVAVV